MGSGPSRPWGDELAEVIGRLSVSETVEQLRREMEDLIERLAQAERRSPAEGPDADRSSATGLNAEIENVGRKVDQASVMLGDLTTLLEAQAERIETLEDCVASRRQPVEEPAVDQGVPTLQGYRQRLQRLEDKLAAVLEERAPGIEPADLSAARAEPTTGPDAGAERAGDSALPPTEPAAERPMEPATAPPTEPAAAAPDQAAGYAGQFASMEVALAGLDRRFEQFSIAVQEHLVELNRRLQSAEGASAAKDRRIRELEERLLIMVEAAVPTQESLQSRPPVWPQEPAVTESPAGAALSAAAASTGASIFAPTIRASCESAESGVPAASSYGTAERLEAGRGEAAVGTAGRGEQSCGAEAPALAGDSVGKTALGELAELEKIVDRELSVRERGVKSSTANGVAGLGKEHPVVMVVDDAVDARTVLSLYLSRTGFQVVTATSAEDCLAKLRYHDVDAIVLDASLPGADGGHVCRVLRSEEAYASKRATPVIVYTGYPDEYTRKLVAEWRANDYVVKGGDMLPLMTSLIRHTRRPEPLPA